MGAPANDVDKLLLKNKIHNLMMMTCHMHKVKSELSTVTIECGMLKESHVNVFITKKEKQSISYPLGRILLNLQLHGQKCIQIVGDCNKCLE